jgi:PAS domain S-box-containing protein
MFIDGIDKVCLLDVNEAFERISGYRSEEVVGRALSELGLFLDLHVLEQARRRVREEGSYCKLESRIRKKSGEIITILSSAERITLNGRLCSIGGAVNVTDRSR